MKLSGLNLTEGKKKLVVIFGGQSSEHEVSCVSGTTVIEAVKESCADEYDIIPVGITKSGSWLLAQSIDDIRSGAWKNSELSVIISPQSDKHQILILDKDKSVEAVEIDVVFPVLHGLYGEDGTVQGLLELAHIPYVGCGHLSSAVTMDKFFTKILAETTGTAQAAFVPVRSYELSDMDKLVAKIEKEREYPVFIKPSNAGSSVGITKAHNREELIEGLKIAAENDTKILVEEAINGRDIECAVFGYGDEAFATGVGEIVAAAEFYSYDAKYNNAESKTIISPELPEGKLEEIQKAALAIYKACDCYGFSRVDFFLENGTNRVVFNEINTIPGHTSISMYPMLMKAAGYEMKDYVKKLIDMAYRRRG